MRTELLRLVGRRLVQLAVVLVVVSFFTFLLIRLLPGDPVQTIIPFGQGPQFAHERAQLRADLGLNKGFFGQYWSYLTGLLQGKLGHQYSSSLPVSTLVKQSLPVSLQLMIYAQVISLVFAIPLGVLAAYRAGTKTDSAINTSSFALLALPNFVLALLLSFFIGAKLKWLPTGGYAPGWLDPLFDGSQHMNIAQHLRYMVLPAFTLAVGQIAVYMRLLRSDMIATLQENFITLAKAKGLKNRRILWRHALRPSSLTMLTVAGLNVGTLIGGAVVVEVIFQIPGMGEKIFQAIASRSYVELQSYVVIIAVLFVVINFLVDFLYAVLDPRIRRARTAT
jgi:peptide/nickel transport system permease protein